MVVETKNKKQTKKKNHIRQAASESHNFFSSLKKGRANRKSNSLIRRKQFRWNQTVKKREAHATARRQRMLEGDPRDVYSLIEVVGTG